MSQIDDLNAAQALIATNITVVDAALDALSASEAALASRIAALPTGPDLQPNIDTATAQATQVSALGDRVTFVKNQLDGLAT